VPGVSCKSIKRNFCGFANGCFRSTQKLDGFRAVASVEGGTSQLVSRNRNVFKTFDSLARAIDGDLCGRAAILHGDIASRPDGGCSTN
jgi:ATP-dependent DNA ligase